MEDFDAGAIAQLAKALGSGQNRSRRAPTYNNPKKYPRSIPITDEAAVAKLNELEELFKEARKLYRKLQARTARANAVKEELFESLEELYPTIGPDGSARGGGTGFREWESKWYYVSWDAKDERQAAKRGDLDDEDDDDGEYEPGRRVPGYM